MSNYLMKMIISSASEAVDPWYIPLTFTAEQANSTVKLTKSGSPTVDGLQYRIGTSGEWLPYTIDTVITLANVGDIVQFQNTKEALSSNYNIYVKFVMTGKIAASREYSKHAELLKKLPNILLQLHVLWLYISYSSS